MHEESQWSNNDRVFEGYYQLAFLPLSLATWTGQALSEAGPGRADEYLLLPTIADPEVILKVVDEMPQFPGCEAEEDPNKRRMCSQQELLKFIYSNISYPTLARVNGVEGTVVITFVVEKDGTISNARIVRDIGAGCGEESLRVVLEMNAQNKIWKPGRMYDRPVRVQFNLPVKFKLESPKETKRRRRRG